MSPGAAVGLRTELSADEDLLQPEQVSVGVHAVAGRGPDLWHRKPDGIVVMQRADGTPASRATSLT